jgi:hypothetical protein
MVFIVAVLCAVLGEVHLREVQQLRVDLGARLDGVDVLLDATARRSDVDDIRRELSALDGAFVLPSENVLGVSLLRAAHYNVVEFRLQV